MFRVLLHLFIPHSSNNHRAKLLHIDSLFLYVLIFGILQFSINIIHKNFPEVLGYATDINIERLLASTNVKRKENGLSELRLNEKLSLAARLKAQDMFKNNYWAHNSPSGKTPWEFISSSGYQYTVAGENLAKNFNDSDGVVAAWMTSSSHRENLLKQSYHDIGFAVVNGLINGEETTLVVQMFGTTPEAVVAAQKSNQTVGSSNFALGQKAVEVPVNATVQDVSVEAINRQPVVQVPSNSIAEVISSFNSVTKRPVVDINTLIKSLSLIFVLMLMGVIFLDAWVVRKHKIVRLVGHSTGHLLFLAIILFILKTAITGSIL